MAPYFIRNLVPRRERRTEGRPLLEALSSITLDRLSPLDAHQPTMKPLRRRRRPRRVQPSLLADKLLNPSFPHRKDP